MCQEYGRVELSDQLVNWFWSTENQTGAEELSVPCPAIHLTGRHDKMNFTL
jgi:hypothetical protein